jgi:hypothetical protein
MNVRVPAAAWNAGIKVASGLKVLPGRGMLVRRSASGSTVSLQPKDFQWIHPFQVSAKYLEGAWRFRVAPGFVNGEPPLVEGTAPKKENEEDEEPPNLSILETDWIEARGFLPLGTELNPVPKYFESLGAKNIKVPDVSLENFSSVNASELEDSEPGKPLVKLEIFLSKSRAQLVNSPQVVDATGVSGTIFVNAPRYDTTALNRNGAQPRLLQAPEMPKPNPLNDAALRILGIVPDEPEDRILVAIVYLLADTREAGATPDEGWTAYIEQKLFWNLAHAPKNEVPMVDLPQTTFFTGLAGGLGDILINQNLALLNNLSQQAVNALDTTEVGGRYWTI